MLSHDVNNDTLSAEIWDLIANREVLAVNQAYAGDSGGVFYAAKETVRLPDIERWQAYPGVPNPPESPPVEVPTHQFLSKRLSHDRTRVAVLLMNSINETSHLSLSFEDIPGISCTSGCVVRDIWQHKTLGLFISSWSVEVGAHDAAFILLESAVLSSTTSPLSFPLITFVILTLSVTMFLLVLVMRKQKRKNYNTVDHNSVEMDELKPTHGHFS